MARKSKQSKKSVRSKESRSSRQSRSSRRSTAAKRKQRTAMSSRLLPRTAKMASNKTPVRKKFSRASHEMQITDLQFMAKSLGIPFGGLTKTQLVRKINNYA
jgi:hypothetical protein